jgi:hypothetical protein
MKRKLIAAAAALLLCLVFLATAALAADPSDEILNYEITVSVNEDGTAELRYHIDWKVLDDEEYGPLEWVDIGMPNANHSDVTALGSSIDHIKDNGRSLAIYLDRSYYEGEVASFEFSFTQDHMYQIDRFVQGETVFAFTPAWFDGIEVKDLTIRWNADKAGAWQPDCSIENDYLVFTADLMPGDRYSMTVAYPNDAFAFSADRQAVEGQNTGGNNDSYDDPYDDVYDDSYSDDDSDFMYTIIGAVVSIGFVILGPGMFIAGFAKWAAEGLGFGSASKGTEYRKKITRTKIEYYENCPGCGAGAVFIVFNLCTGNLFAVFRTF